MKNFEIKFSLLKTIGISLVVGVFAAIIIFVLLAIPLKYESNYVPRIFIGIGLTIVCPIFFLIVKRALYRKAVISGNEKGIQLTYFYAVFIPWEDIESLRFVAHAFSDTSRKDVLIIMLKDNEIYVKEYIKGISQSAMQRKIRKYLSPLVIDISLFETSPESVQELLEKGLEEHKAKTATL